MNSSLRTHGGPILFILLLSAVFPSALTLFFFPELAHDLSYGIPALTELKLAWEKYGVLDVSFSGFRCLGIPVFANPSSLSFSIFHVMALLAPTVLSGLAIANYVMFCVGGFSAYALGLKLGLRKSHALMLACGWITQGWMMSNVLSGHYNFVQIAVLPLIVMTVLQRKFSWPLFLFSSAFLGHLFYSGGTQLFPLILLGMGFAIGLFWFWRQEFQTDALVVEKKTFYRLAGMVLLALFFALPKIIAVMDFMALYPREVSLTPVSFLRALAYTASLYVWPFPFDVKALTGWWYGDWESVHFVFPFLIYFLLFGFVRMRASVPWKKVGVSLGLLVLVGTILNSGVLGPILGQIPVLKSFHVNPRWNAVMLLPQFLFFAVLVLSAQKYFGVLVTGIVTTLFIAVPFQHIDQRKFHVNYLNGNGIDINRERVGYCYEPIFGYRLERFPLNPHDVDWMNDPLLDPRCYLKSGGCRPGTVLERADVSLLSAFQLKPLGALLPLLKIICIGALFVSVILAAGLALIRLKRAP